MKNLIKKISSTNSSIINQVKVGSRVFTLVRKGKTLRGILDGSEIVASTVDSCFIDKLPKIVFTITEDLLDGDNKGIRFKQNKKEELAKSLSEGLLSEISEHKVPIKTQNMRSFEPIYPVYDLKDPVKYSSVMAKIPQTIHILENITKILDIALNDAMVITRRKLIDTMWGANKTQKVIDEIRVELMKLMPESDRLELYFELIRRSVERLKVFHKRQDADSVKVINNILIPDILNNFENIKRFASDLFFVMSPIVHIDEVFVKNTTYPAKFFLPLETIEAVEDEYKLIVEFLNKVPSIEQEVLNPLDFLRYNSKKIR
jgi:hypothetical protein